MFYNRCLHLNQKLQEMIGLPKVSLQLDRNKEIRSCLEVLAMECDIPVALVTVLGERLSYVKSGCGFPARVSDTFMPFLSRTDAELYMLYDIQQPEAGQVTKEGALPACTKFYAGLPLITSNKLFMGSLCVMDARSRILSAEQQELLAAIADRILSLL